MSTKHRPSIGGTRSIAEWINIEDPPEGQASDVGATSQVEICSGACPTIGPGILDLEPAQHVMHVKLRQMQLYMPHVAL